MQLSSLTKKDFNGIAHANSNSEVTYLHGSKYLLVFAAWKAINKDST